MGSYLTPAEYQAAPTATDISNLVYGGSAAAQAAELVNVIARASAWIDTTCRQPLIAASHIEFLRTRVQRDGFLSLHPARSPLNQLVAVAVGTTAANLTAISDLTGAFIDQQQWIVPSNVLNVGWPYTLGSAGRTGQILAKLTSVSGWPNTTIVSGGNAGSTALTVLSGAGFTPAVGSEVAEQTITIYDADHTEIITVSAVNGNVLTCSALVYAHAAGVAISGMPADVKQVAIDATTAFIRSRSTDAVTMDQTTPGAPTGVDPVGAAMLGRAARMLLDYGRVR